PIALVADRPRRTIALAEGLDRDHPVVFSVVGLRIDGLSQYLAEIATDQKTARLRATPVLVSLARSVGHSRLRYLRAHAGPDLAHGFLLDRGRLLIVPVGLRSAARPIVRPESNDTNDEQQLLRAVLAGMSQFPSLGPPCVLDSAPPGSAMSPA